MDNKKLQGLEEKYTQAKDKLDLVSAILSAELPSNAGLIEFKRLLREDFFNFANEESSVAEEAACVLRLQNIEKELELMSNYSAIIGKTRIAVAGGFSSGKSSFLNGIIPDTNIKLPTGVNPVTAIPTYIISQQSKSADTTITAFSTKGGNTPISSEIYNKLSHDFINSLGFNLKDILAFMAITISEKRYEHICFIDTPGISNDESDKKTASEFVEQSDIVLWCIDIERGTVPKTDLEFIREHLKEKTIYVVMSKADIKSSEEIEDILDEVEEMLHDEDIAIEGISACSFLNGKEKTTSRKMSIYDFLTLYNKNSTKHEKETLIARVEEVCDIYDKAINESIKFSKEHKEELRSIGLDVLALGEEDEEELARKRLKAFKMKFGEASKAFKVYQVKLRETFEAFKVKVGEASGVKVGEVLESAFKMKWGEAFGHGLEAFGEVVSEIKLKEAFEVLIGASEALGEALDVFEEVASDAKLEEASEAFGKAFQVFKGALEAFGDASEAFGEVVSETKLEDAFEEVALEALGDALERFGVKLSEIEKSGSNISISDKLREMQQKFDYKKHQGQLKKLATIRTQMIGAIHDTFKASNSKKR